MDWRQRLIRNSLHNSYDCIDKERRLQVPRVVPLWQELGKAVDRVNGLERDQGTTIGTRGHRARRMDQLRHELRVVHLKRIAKRGKVVLHGYPGIRDLLRLPDASCSTEELLKGAVRIFDTVRPYADVFVSGNVPADFLEQAERVAEQLDACRLAPGDGDAIRARATAALPDELRRGRAIVAALDAEIDVEFAGQSDLLATWKNASRVGSRIGRPPKRRSAARGKKPGSSVNTKAAAAAEVTT